MNTTTSTEGLKPEEFREEIRKHTVRCLICGYRGHSLTAHLRDKHALTPGQYQAKFPKLDGHDNRLFSPITAALLKNLNRSPKASAEWNDFLPPFQPSVGTDTVQAIVDYATTGKIIRNPEAEGVLIPGADQYFYFDPNNSRAISVALAAGMNAYLAGPTGSGKTELIRQTHALLKKTLVRLNLNGDASRGSLLGEMRATPQKGTYFHKGALVLAMEHGATLLLDEVDYGPPHVLAVCNSVLEGTRSLFLEETGETIIAKPGFQVFATANTGGKGDLNGVYTGTEILNTAFLDRFAMRLNCDYLPFDEEVKMLANRFPAEKKEYLELLVKFAKEVREAFQRGQLAVTVSTRKLIEILRMKVMLDEKTALDNAIMNWLDKDDVNLVKGIGQRTGLF